MRKVLIFFLTFILGVAGFVIAMKSVGWQTIPEAFKLFLSPTGLVLLFLTFLINYLGFLKWRFVLKKLSGQPDFRGLSEAWLGGFTISYLLTPIAFLGGEPFRAYFVKEKYHLDWGKSAASVIIERLLEWTVLFLGSVPALLVFLMHSRVIPGKIFPFAGAGIIGLFILLFIFYFKSLKKESMVEWFLNFLGLERKEIENSHRGKLIFGVEKEIINFFSPKGKIFWQGISLTVLRYLFYFLRVWFLIFSLHCGTSLSRAFAVYGVTNLAVFFPTPAALGSLEATGILSFGALDFKISQGTILALLLRNADILLSLVGLFFLVKVTIYLTGRKILSFFGGKKFKSRQK